MVDQVVAQPKREPVTLRLSRAQRVIGMPVTLAQCQQVFQRLGLSYSTQAAGDDTHLVVTPPSWRFDLQIEEDLIEEVVRDRLRAVANDAPKAPVVSRVRPEAQRGNMPCAVPWRNVATRKPSTSSFVEERWEADFAGNTQAIRVLNPIASQLSVMRST